MVRTTIIATIALHVFADVAATGHGFSGKTQGVRIDFIFVRKHDEILDARIIHYNDNGLYPSDHFPVTARVRLVSG